jgi:hypothetical protein
MMMQPTDLWHLLYGAEFRRLHRAWDRRVHVQCSVRSPGMIVRGVAGQEPPQMALVQDDHVVQAFAADTPDQPFEASG